MNPAALERAADWLKQADGLLVTAGAGMGIDSGLPDFRGPGGFWAVYPALGRARLRFEAIANPAAFIEQPRLAWGFYGHRLDLYRRTQPHEGFARLLQLASRLRHGVQVFTSNVDGQFQQAGYPAERICEVHGSIHHLQCLDGCREAIWNADGFTPDIDADACQLRNAPPLCPHCGRLARPNILLFGDWGWLERRTRAQYGRLQQWLGKVERPLSVEIGAGLDIPTVRRFSEQNGWRLIRINPNEADVPDPAKGIGIEMGGKAGIAALIDALAD